MKGNYLYEEVNKNMSKMLIHQCWIKKNETGLIKSSVSWKRFEELNAMLDHLICPKKTIHE